MAIGPQRDSGTVASCGSATPRSQGRFANGSMWVTSDLWVVVGPQDARLGARSGQPDTYRSAELRHRATIDFESAANTAALLASVTVVALVTGVGPYGGLPGTYGPVGVEPSA